MNKKHYDIFFIAQGFRSGFLSHGYPYHIFSKLVCLDQECMDRLSGIIYSDPSPEYSPFELREGLDNGLIPSFVSDESFFGVISRDDFLEQRFQKTTSDPVLAKNLLELQLSIQEKRSSCTRLALFCKEQQQ